MKKLDTIRSHCEEVSRMTFVLIDDFILHYAAAKDNLSREFDVRIASLQAHHSKETKWVNMLQSQYIIDRVFNAGGLVRKYLLK